MRRVRGIIISLFATFAITGLTIPTPAQAQTTATADDFVFSSVAVQRPRDPETVRTSLYIKCPSRLGQWRVEVDVRQRLPEQSPSQAPAVSYTGHHYGYFLSCTGTPEHTESIRTDIDPGSQIVRPTTADITVRLSRAGVEPIVYHAPNQKVTALPCCGPKIQTPRYAKLITTSDPAAPYGGRRNAVSLQLPYVCWPFPDDIDVTILVSLTAPRSDGSAWYVTSTNDGYPFRIPHPTCNGHWQYPTVILAQLNGYKLRPGETVDAYGSIQTVDDERVTGFRDYYVPIQLRR